MIKDNKKKISLRKHAILKKSGSYWREDKQKGSTKTARKEGKSPEEGIELPFSKILFGVAVIVIIALLIFAVVKLQKPAQKDTGIAASVSGQLIRWDEIEKKYEAVPANMRSIITKEVLLNQTINEIVLKQQIAEKNVSIDKTELKNLIENIKGQFTDEAEFNRTLESQNLNYSEFVSQIGLRLELNKLMQQEIPELKVNESEITSFFEENNERLATAEQVRASHILVNSSEEANKIIERLRKGSDFGELAKNYSIDTGSAVMGGDLGYFGRGMMVPEFETVAFSLKVGEISAPVKTDFGYHIIKVTDKKPAKQASLGEMHVLIELSLFNSKLDLNKDLVNNYIEGLHTKANVKIYPQKSGK